MTSARLLILDTNAVINLKTIVPLGEQWSFFKKAEAVALRGYIAFPKQVLREISDGQHPDMPGAWLVGIAPEIRHDQPSEESLIKVLNIAPGMVDPDSGKDRADPYVVAMAIEIRDGGKFDVAVVSDDRVDRAGITSVATACRLLDVNRISVEDFIAWIHDQTEDRQDKLFE